MGIDGKLYSVSDKKGQGALLDFVGKGYVLVADGDKNMQAIIRNMFRLFGIINVITTDNGQSALSMMVKSEGCRFAVIDLDLPRMSGIHVVKEIRASKKLDDLNVLMVAMEGDSDVVAQAAEFGANGYIIKPFVAKLLEEKLLKIVHMKSDPPEHVKLILAGEQLMREGKYDDALKLYLKSRDLRDAARIDVHLGEVYEKLGGNGMAHELYLSASKKNPEYLKAYISAANLYLKEENEIAAVEAFEKASLISPFNADRKTSMGKIYLNIGEEKNAYKALNDAVEVDQSKCNEIAEICLDAGKADKAERYFRKSLGRATGELSADEKKYFVHTYNRLGIALRRQGKWEGAIVEYKKALMVMPNTEDIYFNMGRSFLEGGGTDKAKACFEEALKLDPDFEQAKKELDKINNSQTGGTD